MLRNLSDAGALLVLPGEAFLYGLFGYGSREACAGSQSKTARRH